MPIYEYRCESCRHELEVIQKFSDPPLSDCPACSEPALKKRMSAAAFRLKGGGWYETDFKKDGKRNLAGDSGGDGGKSPAAGAEAKTGSTGEARAESKRDAKPATVPAASDG